MTEKKPDSQLKCLSCLQTSSAARAVPAYVRLCPSCHRLYDENVRFCEADESKLVRVNPRGQSMYENQCVKDYVLQKLIGIGCSSEVWMAVDRRSGRKVAIKLLRVYGQDPAAVLDSCIRFFREAKAVSALGHPNIIELLDHGLNAESGQAYQVFELLSGQPLAACIRQWRMPHDLASVLTVAIQVADGMARVHAAGILHRDLKPSNLYVVEKDGRLHVKILDFGLAKFRDTSTLVTITQNMAVGTPAYLSPEQAQGEALTEGSDIYNLGVVLFEMLTRKLPFRGQPMQLLQSHVSKPVPDPRTIAAWIPEELAQIVMTALEKESASRFPDMVRFASALRRVLNYL